MVEPAIDGAIPVPGFPGRDPARKSGLRFRDFGTAEADLAVDFDATNRAVLVTRLLELCSIDSGEGLPDGFYRELSAGKRIEFLVALAGGGGKPALKQVFRCAGCGEELELELEMAELSELQRRADEFVTVDVDLGDVTVQFRKPRGTDQELWGEIVAESDREGVLSMIETLAVDKRIVPDLSDSAIDAIESALDEADPLVNFFCQVECGECGQTGEFGVDLTQTALEIMRRAQFKLTVMVHRLASHYHWNESEIFAVPDRRRRQYLELIAAGRR